ncbi:MAG: tetratricopeptide repeat protein [Terracidiphilus sp.]
MRILLRALISLFIVLPLSAQTPAAPAADVNLAKAHDALERNQPAEAIAILQQLAQAQPSMKGVQHELGLAYYRTGKLMDAKNAFTNAINQDNSDRESVQMEGLTLYRLGQPAAAIPYLEKVLQWMPNANTDAKYVLGLCYLNAQRYDDARASFASQFGVDPNSAGAYLLLGTMLRHANLPELAAVQAQKALALSPNLPLAHFMVGEVALFKSDVDRAIAEFEAERRINPDYAPVYDRLGDVYLRAERLDDAQQALTKAIALDTTLTGAFIKMGKVLLRKQDLPTAVMYLKHAEKMDAEDFTTHTLLSQAYHKMGLEEDAKREVGLASKIHADNQLKLYPDE